MTLHPLEALPDEPTRRALTAVELDSAADIYSLLSQAAEMAAKAGLPPEVFAAAAWQAFLGASPGLAEHLAELQFDAAVEELRNSGRLAKA